MISRRALPVSPTASWAHPACRPCLACRSHPLRPGFTPCLLVSPPCFLISSLPPVSPLASPGLMIHGRASRFHPLPPGLTQPADRALPPGLTYCPLVSPQRFLVSSLAPGLMIHGRFKLLGRCPRYRGEQRKAFTGPFTEPEKCLSVADTPAYAWRRCPAGRVAAGLLPFGKTSSESPKAEPSGQKRSHYLPQGS